ncbi:hypothetical protein [Oceanobacillus sp. J11TS1]|uniref:hypothetical protein n=1 Tax=Oceanobacillus sp. J11TS1 TaxID=2807191 RepID=UPI001B183F2E|nr:hypothetical protein [Oceanobacillus sp. J11TS1]GIO22810.1 hypothetical protein J11TS1_13910 [Oceanobacillus sp. J11TS1]
MNQKSLKFFVILLCLCLATPPFSSVSAGKLDEDEELLIENPIFEGEEIKHDEGLYDGKEVVLDEYIDPVVLYAEDFEGEKELEAKVTELLNDELVSGVQVISKTEERTVGSQATRLPGQWYKQGRARIKYLKLSDAYGPTINSAAGDPGITMDLPYSKSHAATYSGDYGLTSSIISMAVGFNVTGSYSVSSAGSYKVPSTVDKKKVKTATINSKLIYQRCSYTVVSPEYPSGKEGTAKKPIGIYYQKKITYK